MWLFLVVLRKSADGADTFFCSGTLISDSKVLLAAQCLEKMSVYEISSVTVLIGLTSVTAGTQPATGPPIPGSSVAQMTKRISKVVIHSGYNAANFAIDIAIITLDMPIVISNKVGPVCLPPASTDPDQYGDQAAAVMGPTTKGAGSTALKQGKVAIGSVADCKAEAGYGKCITDSSICIAPAGLTTFTCPGDIGGPVVIKTAPATAGTPPVWTIVGINSFTADDACVSSGGITPKTAMNGLKTRVSAFSSWIATYTA